MLEANQSTIEDNQSLSDGLPNLGYPELLKQQMVAIQALENQVDDLKEDKKNLYLQIATFQEIVTNQQTLSLQQNQHTNLLIDKPKPRGFLSWFGMNGQKEEKTS